MSNDPSSSVQQPSSGENVSLSQLRELLGDYEALIELEAEFDQRIEDFQRQFVDFDVDAVWHEAG